jgi:uncharacterized phage protein gp47/JayE
MQSLTNLRQPITRAEALERVLEMLQAEGFDTTGWQEGRIQRTLITIFATILADHSEVDRIIADGGFNEYASGVLLELFSASRYGNLKVDARATSGPCYLSNASTSSYTLKAGGLIAATANGVQFRLTEDVTIPAGPSLVSARFTAVVRGAAGNVSTGAISTLVTPLAGVTIANTGSPWYDVSGRDLESDESLRTRNTTQWSRLSVELIADAYVNIARDFGAAEGKVMVHDDNPRGPGTIDVYAAGATSLLSDAELTALQGAYAVRAFQTDSAWPPAADSRVKVVHPYTAPLSVTATLYHDPGTAGSVIVARANAAMTQFLADTPLGGWDYSPGPANVVLLSDVYDRLKDIEGVSGVVMSLPSADWAVGSLNLVTQGFWAFTPVPRIAA